MARFTKFALKLNSYGGQLHSKISIFGYFKKLEKIRKIGMKIAQITAIKKLNICNEKLINKS